MSDFPVEVTPKARSSHGRDRSMAMDTIEINSNTWLPYLHHTTSFDTIIMLANANSDDYPQYANTSHSMTPAPANTKLVLPTDESPFNQVPKRFSQFIIDQQDSRIAQKLDNLSIDSPYSSDMDFNKINKRGSISNARNISDSMDSQATIFSTRDNKTTDPLVIPNDNSFGSLFYPRSIIPKTLRKRFPTKQTSPPSISPQSSLRRRNAIRSNKGSIFYRLKLRLKKIFHKFKYAFRVSSKRTASNTTVNRKLTRKFRQNPRNPSVQRVLQKRALSGRSGPEMAIKSSQFEIEATPFSGKQDHLSEFITEQQNDYLRLASVSADRKQFKELSGDVSNELGQFPKKTHELPKLPEPEPQPQPEKAIHDNLQTIDLWRSYLSQALSKRIQLRQEINLYLSFVANKNQPKFDSEIYPAKTTMSDNIDTRLISVYSITDQDDESFVDESAEEFNNHINRKSMLGDMLEYESGDELSVATTDEPTRTNSIMLSVYAISRYGTVKRTSPSTTMKRSGAIQHDLTLLRETSLSIR